LVKPLRKLPLGRPRRAWDDNIKMDFDEWERDGNGTVADLVVRDSELGDSAATNLVLFSDFST
jgi:hypothetical protein